MLMIRKAVKSKRTYTKLEIRFTLPRQREVMQQPMLDPPTKLLQQLGREPSKEFKNIILILHPVEP